MWGFNGLLEDLLSGGIDSAAIKALIDNYISATNFEKF